MDGIDRRHRGERADVEWPGFLLRPILAKIAKIEKRWKKDRQIDKPKKKTNERRGHTCADQIDAPQR